MRRFLPLCLLLLVAAAPAADAAFYQWTDADGVVHFTDSARKIPKKYRGKAKRVELLDESSAVRAGAPPAPAPPKAPPQASPQAPQPPSVTAGGHPEQWWRDRYSNLRSQMKALQDVITEKQAKLVELRRKRTIYQRARDREAVNAVEADLTADQTQLSEAAKQMDALENEANSAGVPMDWRR